MDLNVWLKGKSVIYIGGDPEKGIQPTVTISLNQAQVVVDETKGVIKISETVIK